MTFLYRIVARFILSALALVAITACGGSSSSSSAPPPPTYSIGGTVSGLDAGQSVVLQDNGGAEDEELLPPHAVIATSASAGKMTRATLRTKNFMFVLPMKK